MKEKIKTIFWAFIKTIVFWSIVLFIGYIAFDTNPETNGMIRFFGFCVAIYWLGKYFYPDKFTKYKNFNDCD